MVASILPLYLVIGLGLSPFVFGVVDGLYPGVTALVRWGGGVLGDRTRQHKALAAFGYAVSTVSRLAWLLVGAHVPGIMATVTADRVGKGIRTAPRDALISLSTTSADLGAAFGVHRAMDAAGAMLGPLGAALIVALAPQRFDFIFVISFSLGIVGLAVLLLLVQNRADADRHTDLMAGAAPMRPSLLPRQRRVWLTLAAGALLAGLLRLPCHAQSFRNAAGGWYRASAGSMRRAAATTSRSLSKDSRAIPSSHENQAAPATSSAAKSAASPLT